MTHPLYRVVAFEVVKPFAIRVDFDDHTSQVIDFRPILHGELYGPLRNPDLFQQVRIDQEVCTLVWPNGADFDPATLHDWNHFQDELQERAQQWA